jgi:hypothetical protein
LVTYPLAVGQPFSDFGFHVQAAADMARTGALVVPHFLFHITTIAVHALLFGNGFGAAATLTTVGFNVLLCTATYLAVRPAAGDSDGLAARALTAGLALALVMVAPITVFTWANQDLYFGYIAISVYHNPTATALKPLALLLGLGLVAACAAGRTCRRIDLLGAGVLAVLATLAKPNYTLCVLPVLLLVGVYRWWRGARFNWPLALAMIIPATAVLAWQYMLEFSPTETMELAPLAVMLHYTSAASLLPKLLLSVAFPLAVYIAYWPDTRDDALFNVSWLVFAAGLGFTYLFAEGGERRFHGNFWWGAQIALFVLFVVAVRTWLRQWRAPAGKHWYTDRRWLLTGLLALHVVSGLVYYWLQVRGGQSGGW